MSFFSLGSAFSFGAVAFLAPALGRHHNEPVENGSKRKWTDAQTKAVKKKKKKKGGNVRNDNKVSVQADDRSTSHKATLNKCS